MFSQETKMEYDVLTIGDITLTSRFILGSGKTAKYTPELIKSAVEDAKAEMISVAIKTLDDEDCVLDYIPEGVRVLPNT